jgi:hypothetical protein
MTLTSDIAEILGTEYAVELPEAHQHLMHLVDVISKSGNPSEPFFYLGGPMTGIPALNFPRFKEVAGKLRVVGYNIISPAELDDPTTEASALASPDGFLGHADGEFDYEHFLSRDLIIVSLPMCVGGIFLEGWHTSRGARGETWVLEFLRKQLWEYEEDAYGLPGIVGMTHRDERLKELGVGAEGVPRDDPGMRTAGLELA